MAASLAALEATSEALLAILAALWAEFAALEAFSAALATTELVGCSLAIEATSLAVSLA